MVAPVLAVLVCHDGEAWLPDVLAALGDLTERPQYVLAVDTGSTDRTAELLAQARADRILDDVLTTSRETGFGAAVAEAVAHGMQQWADPGRWLWLLHDDSAPEPDCLERLLRAAELDSAAALLGPLGLDWADPRRVVDAGLSTDAAGHRRTGIGPSELDPALIGAAPPMSEVLAVTTAGALVRRDVFEQLDGFDPHLSGGVDVDLGWRVNLAGHGVRWVPDARMRHAAARRRSRAAERVSGVRTFLVNAPVWAFLLGLPRLFCLALLRMCGFAALRRWTESGAELAVLRELLSGRMKLLAGRAARATAIPVRHGVRRLFTSRVAKVRNWLRRAFEALVRERVRRDLVLRRAPEGHLIKAVPDGPVQAPELRGLVVVPVPETSAPKPSPSPRDMARPDLLLVPVDRWRMLRELVLAPPVVLVVVLAVFAFVTNGLLADRFGAGLAGGRLLPVADLGTTWRDYLAAWHPVSGGTGSAASPSLLVLALFGTVLGGPSVVVSILLLFGAPLAGLSAYVATRALPVSRLRRAVVAGAYALLPAAALSAGQGRLDVVVAHILVPVLLAGIAAVVWQSDGQWLRTACLTALGLAVLGAFAPLLHVALIVLALLAFVVVPDQDSRGRRRVVGLAAVVLLSVACLLPWPVVLLQHPQVLLHGLGARVVETPAGAWLFALSPDGSPASLVGALFVLAAVVALVAAWTQRMLLGVAVAIFGWALAALVDVVAAEPIAGGQNTTGWTGGPLVLVAAGCGWVVLVARKPRVPGKVVVPLLVVGLLGLASAAAFTSLGGPLRVQQHTAADLPGSLLVLDPGPQPARLVDGTGPRFGDDDLAPVATAVDWLRRVDDDLQSADPARVRGALAAAAARGVGFIAVPDGSRLPESAPDLVAEHDRLPDGHRVLSLLLPSSPVELLGPDLARQARTEPAPTPEARPLPVAAQLPNFTVRISEGGAGRALVLGAENEPGWYVRIDGRPFPLATAWGHQVAIPLPENSAEVRVGYTEIPRTALLGLQAAVVLFTLVAALPERRSRSRAA
ncbi:glycosyltransferase family 2 protein [Saccharopolyspora sp. K220]|uniref:glycosyltransferase family 2 protein n=1 Tax=Saccharopolyspora soli TaxID=2926618 RepID=UPI001F59A543|nr:glycosyltransferase family 2 protein [Saccharopolyspora soli]MCI2422177.1 glycosyltransferase family 2 protein [Saccharopolyspora soli]